MTGYCFVIRRAEFEGRAMEYQGGHVASRVAKEEVYALLVRQNESLIHEIIFML
jgi:hypothetical protein